jgi:hypothetical protein
MHPTQGRFPFDCRYNKDEVLSILRFFFRITSKFPLGPWVFW